MASHDMTINEMGPLGDSTTHRPSVLGLDQFDAILGEPNAGADNLRTRLTFLTIELVGAKRAKVYLELSYVV